jgi:RHS repeat-associated protein
VGALEELFLPLSDRRLRHLQPPGRLDLSDLTLQNTHDHGQLLIRRPVRLTPHQTSSKTGVPNTYTCPRKSDPRQSGYTYDAAESPTIIHGTTAAYDDATELCWTSPTPSTNSCGTAPTGATTYTYNTRGDRTDVTPPTGTAVTLGYNEANELDSYGSTATYTYDGNGLRASKTVSGTTQHFTYDITASTPEVLTDSVNAYIYGPDGSPIEQIALSGGTATWLHTDQQGSVRVLTSNSGSVTGTVTYTPYGEDEATTGSLSPLGYQSAYTDAETGYLYLINRYYDPATAQFLTVDPEDATTRSAYGYVDDNPINGSDPSGLMSCTPDGPCGTVQYIICQKLGVTDEWDSGQITLPYGPDLTLSVSADITATAGGDGSLNFNPSNGDFDLDYNGNDVAFSGVKGEITGINKEISISPELTATIGPDGFSIKTHETKDVSGVEITAEITATISPSDDPLPTATEIDLQVLEYSGLVAASGIVSWVTVIALSRAASCVVAPVLKLVC